MQPNARDAKGRFMAINENSGSTLENAGDSDSSQPQYVTEDRLAAIVNAAVTGHLKRSLGKEIGSALEAYDTKRRAEKAARKAEEDAEVTRGAPVAKQPSPEVAALEKRLSDMQAMMRSAQEEAASERQRAREHKAYGDLKSELNGKVRPEALDAVADLLFHARKRVSVDEDGNTLFAIRQAPAKGLPDADVNYPLSDGVREFLKTKEAALFVPSPGQGAAVSKPQPRFAPPPMPVRGQAQSQTVVSPMSDDEKASRAMEFLAAAGLSLP